jgi:hypothetical protein
MCDRGIANPVIARPLSASLQKKQIRPWRWIDKQLHAFNASRNHLVLVLAAFLLVIAQLTSTPAPAYAQADPPSLSGTVTGLGLHSSGAIFIDLQLKNSGTGSARNIQINQIQLRTLSGSGTVTYNSTLSPMLPLSVGDLTAGAFTSITLYFNVPSTVLRFSMTENGTLQDSGGTNLSFSIAQAVIPTSLPATLTSIAVTPANPSIAKGAQQQFTATGTFSDNTTQNLTSQVTWASATTSVATITAGGLASAINPGTSMISATQGSVSGTTT